MKALVTGATGFIGGALANALLKTDWQVSLLIRPGSRARLTSPERFQVIEADLAQPEKLPAALSGLEPDVVVHAAAIRNRWGTPPEDYYTTNVTATQVLLEAALGRAKRFVFLSSVGVFGRPGVVEINEDFPVKVSPNWNYHSSKAAGEQIVLARADQIETVIVRPTITYGPGDIDGMVTRLIQMVINKRLLRIGQGDNHVHLTYIDDLVAGLKLTISHPSAPGKTYTLAGPEPIKMNALLAMIEQETNQQLPSWHLPQTATYMIGAICEAIYHLLPNSWNPPITRDKVDNLCANRGFSMASAANQLGYQPKWTYQAGIQRTFDWLQSSADWSAS